MEEALAGRSQALKEAVIGNAVYGRDPPYDPRIDSTVRVEARRLRRKLDEHYEGTGRSDPVKISLRTGGYVPTFAWQSGVTTARSRPHEQGIFEEGAGAAIAIMPFRALSRGVADEAFADGLTDELIYTMHHAKGIRITSRSAAFQYKDRPYSLRTLAAELGVAAVLQGTVRIESNIIRITIEASDANGFVVWSDRFNAPDEDRMSLQERVAATVLSRMQVDSSLMRSMKLSPSAEAIEAVTKIYRGRNLIDKQTPAALREAMTIFTEVAQTAADYARGHSGLADCYCDMFRLGMIDHETAANGSKSALRKALEIDPKSVEAHTASATIAAWLDRDAVRSEASFRQAVQSGENARAARLYGVFLTHFGRYEEAARLFKDARRIEPFSIQQDIAETVSHFQTRNFSALTEVSLLNLGDVPVEILVYRALAHIFGGDPEKARLLIADIDYRARSHPTFMLARAEIEAWLKEPSRAMNLLSDDTEEATCFARATLAAAVDDAQKSLDFLEQSMKFKELSIVWIRNDPRFDKLRDHPRFVALLDQLNLTNPETLFVRKAGKDHKDMH